MHIRPTSGIPALGAVALAALLSAPATARAADKPSAPSEERAPKACAAPLEAAPATEVGIGDRTATSTGYKLTFKGGETGRPLVLGVLGPINEDSGVNMLALRHYRQFFEQEKADAIVVTGDLPELSEGIARALGELARSKLPVLVVIGNRECQPEFTRGVALAHTRSSGVVNLNVVREVEFPQATLVSLPGYHDPDFIHCESGCRYYKSTLDEVVRLAKEAKGPVVLISHGPPRGGGSQSIDYARTGGNVGDPDINRAMRDGHIAFGVFSNIKEAGARATDAAGTTLIEQGVSVPELLLNPGPANAARQEMNDHTRGYGFAAVLSLKGKEASWKLYRGKALTPEERKEARALEPTRAEDEARPAPARP